MPIHNPEGDTMYISLGISPNGPLDVKSLKVDVGKPEWNYALSFGYSDRVYLSTAELLALVRAGVTALYDDGSLDMPTAERLAYLCQSVLMDGAEYRETVMMEAGEDF